MINYSDRILGAALRLKSKEQQGELHYPASYTTSHRG